jgi:septum formation topological specificity factor MinE
MFDLQKSAKFIYRKIIPSPIKKFIYDRITSHIYEFHRNNYFYKLKKEIVKFLKKDIKRNSDQDKVEVLNYLKDKENPFYMVPYNFIKNYKKDDIIVYTDTLCDMSYVLFDKKRMYFPVEWKNPLQIKEYYNAILIEHDILSPHRYELNDFCVQENDIAADIGAAEGFFALSVIEKCKKIYLFECDEQWIRALKMTFEPWKEKISIINKYVSDNNEMNNVKLDDFFNEKPINFIKVDIEGAESQFLTGASKILRVQKPLRIAICTYHKKDDADEFNNLLTKNGFKVDFSRGYLLPWMKLDPPYLRKGLIRATKI